VRLRIPSGAKRLYVWRRLTSQAVRLLDVKVRPKRR
jgi:hypothetical protein